MKKNQWQNEQVTGVHHVFLQTNPQKKDFVGKKRKAREKSNPMNLQR